MKALVFALLISSSVAAHAHSFYEGECCSDKDCWPMGLDSDAKEPDPTIVPGGYLTHDGIFIAESEARISKDGRYHICRSDGALNGNLIKPTGRPKCFYIPAKGT